MTVPRTLRTTDKPEPAGGEQAANALQPDSSSRHAMTSDAKVGSTIAASPLVASRPCLFSHGRGHRFETCHAHHTKPAGQTT
jgi:hypothetical protein